MTLAERRPDIARQFASFLVPAGDGCQLWTGFCPGGTPKFFLNGPKPARRVALRLAGLPRPWKAKLIAGCGNTRCVALAHILPVKPARKRVKRVKKRLDAQTKQQIIGMRHGGATLTATAACFGVSVCTVLRLAGPFRRGEGAALG